MADTQIFISYRRDDSAGYARALHDALARRFGERRVFIDVDDIGAGQRFAAVIAAAVGRSEVLLVLIGPRWAGPRTDAPDRVHDPDDFVRREVEAAFAAGAQVIPVLLDGTAMPAAEQLPPSLRALPARHAVELRGSQWAADLARLLDALAALVEPAAPPPAALPPPPSAPPAAARPARRRALHFATASLGLAAAAALAWWWRGAGRGAPDRAAVNGRWQAAVVYPWSGVRHDERFEFAGDGGELRGSASFLRLPRSITAGRVEGERLFFETRSQEVDDGTERTLVHRYEGRLVGDRLQLTMQTHRSGIADAPLAIAADRIAGAAP